MEESTTKKCPFCKEDIHIDAKKCRHCGNWLSMYKGDEETSAADQATDVLFGCIIPLIKIAIPLVIAYFLVPSEAKIEREVTKSAVECIVDSYSDNELINVLGGGEFWSALVDLNREQIASEFTRKNGIEVNRKWFWANAKIYNNQCYDGEVVMFSIFGLNIPMIDIDDIEL